MGQRMTLEFPKPSSVVTHRRSRIFPPRPTGDPQEDFYDLVDWRRQRSSESALGRLEVFANRVRHTLPFWRLMRRF